MSYDEPVKLLKTTGTNKELAARVQRAVEEQAKAMSVTETVPELIARLTADLAAARAEADRQREIAERKTGQAELWESELATVRTQAEGNARLVELAKGWLRECDACQLTFTSVDAAQVACDRKDKAREAFRAALAAGSSAKGEAT